MRHYRQSIALQRRPNSWLVRGNRTLGSGRFHISCNGARLTTCPGKRFGIK